MSELPKRALYKCPEHGVFVKDTDGVMWRERSCPVRIGSDMLGNISYPCGILSPLAHIDDPDVLNGPIHGLDSQDLSDLHESLRAALAARKQAEKDGRELIDDKPSFGIGGRQNRRNGRLALPPAPVVDVEQELFEKAERERMRAAMDEAWDGCLSV